VTLDVDTIVKATRTVARYLPPTPLWSYPLLDRAVGARVYLKHENTQPTGAFKVRGGVALFAAMDAAALHRGVVTASTGNHAQSMAYGARLFGSSATVVMPTSAPPEKVAATRALGAQVVTFGPTMSEALEESARIAELEGRRLISPGNEPEIIAGHAGIYVEIFDQEPDLDHLVVPVGSGTGAAGACLVAQWRAPSTKVVGVQSSQAPAAQQAWRSGRAASAACDTRVSGLATGHSFDLPQSVLVPLLTDFVLVSDDEISAAAALIARTAHTLVETAGAAALAAVIATPALRTGRVAVVLTGGNAGADEIADLARY
jgi:threonine dehydratase